MKIATVTLTRLGNKYLREYVDYYKKLGVDKMYFYDNNQENEQKVIEVLTDYVNEGFVEIIPFYNVDGKLQNKAYQDFYDKHGKEYDWICFFDDDEYLTLNFCDNLKIFLSNSKFEGINGVCFPMINFCDTGLIVNPKNTRLDVYTKIKDLNDIFNRSFYKTIVRGGINVYYKDGYYENNGNIGYYTETQHVPVVDGICFNGIVDCDGNKINNGIDNQFKVINGYIKHFPTGCIDDYINMKMKRDWPDTNNRQNFGYAYFTYYNNHTDEKYNYFLSHLNK